MFITIKADIEVPDELTDYCPGCSKDHDDLDKTMKFYRDASVEPEVFFNPNDEEELTVKYCCRCAECGTPVIYYDRYIYSNTFKDSW